jgi:hypothetical protein
MCDRKAKAEVFAIHYFRCILPSISCTESLRDRQFLRPSIVRLDADGDSAYFLFENSILVAGRDSEAFVAEYGTLARRRLRASAHSLPASTPVPGQVDMVKIFISKNSHLSVVTTWRNG